MKVEPTDKSMSYADSLVNQADYYGPEIHHPNVPVMPQREGNIQLALEQAYCYLHGEEAVHPDMIRCNLRIALVEMRGEEWVSGFDKAARADR